LEFRQDAFLHVIQWMTRIPFTNRIWTVGPALVAAPWHADQPFDQLRPAQGLELVETAAALQESKREVELV
jgi:hypothetical protein